jgi:hypothetical protein
LSALWTKLLGAAALGFLADEDTMTHLLRLGFFLLFSALALVGCVPARYAQPSRSPAATGITLDAGQYDAQLEETLNTLYQRFVWFRPYLVAASERGIRLTVSSSLSPDVAGEFTPASREIALNRDIMRAPLSYIASVVAHELVHAATWKSGDEAPYGCFEQEIHARTVELLIFAALTSSSEWDTDGLAAGEEQRVVDARQRGVLAQVVLDPAYQVECLSRQLHGFSS